MVLRQNVLNGQIIRYSSSGVPDVGSGGSVAGGLAEFPVLGAFPGHAVNFVLLDGLLRLATGVEDDLHQMGVQFAVRSQVVHRMSKTVAGARQTCYHAVSRIVSRYNLFLHFMSCGRDFFIRTRNKYVF